MNATHRNQILFAILALILLSPVHAILLTEKQSYEVGDAVTLTLPEGFDGRIIIEGPEAKYRMLGAPKASNPFRPSNEGTYTVQIYNEENDLIAQSSFIVTPKTNTENLTITIDPENGYANRPIMIRLDPKPQGNVDVRIRAPGGSFQYSGPWSDAPFTPTTSGPHQIIISQNGEVLGTRNLLVQPESQAPQIETSPTPTTPAEPEIPPTESEEAIPDDSNGTLENITTIEAPPPNMVDAKEPVSIREPIIIQDSKGRQQTTSVAYFKKEGQVQQYDAEIIPTNRQIAKRIRIRDLSPTTNMRFGVDEVPLQNAKIPGAPAIKAYAINFDALNFSTATVTSVAEGTHLYKCAAWNFLLQECLGTWVKIADITPGEEYNITLYPGDPGYAETGVATVNSDKPVYLPGETATLWMAVLDTGGYLVNEANISLSIQSPNGTTTIKTTDALQIVEVSRGIYSTTYPVSEAGNYTLIVRATGNNVNSTLFNTFAVLDSYPFDILRETPLSTDPFKGPFESKITVKPRIETDDDLYSLTEVLPDEFTIENTGGADISRDSTSFYLTWNDLSGNATVSYSAQPPLKTPALFALGKAFVTYIKNGITTIFVEMRAWFLAIDPEVSRDEGLVVYGDRSPDGSVKYRNWTGTLMQDETDSGLDFVDRTSWFKFRCSSIRSECLLLASDGGNDLNFAVFDTNTWIWRNFTQLDSNMGQDDQMQFDVECEDVSGDCVIVFEDTTTADTTFEMHIWNASGLQSAQTVTITGAESNDFDWIKLYPLKDTDYMGIAMQNDGGGGNSDTPAIYGGIWNGSAFNNWSELTNVGPAQGNTRTFFKHFDCGWEGGTADFLCFYGENNLNGIEAQRWNGAWTNLGTVYGATGDEVLEVAVCGQEPWSDFSHNYLGVMFCDDAADLDGTVWNGSALNKTTTTQDPSVNTNAECGSNKGTTDWGRPFECRWERSGDQIIFVWVAGSNQDWLTAGTYTLSTETYSMSDWTTGTQIVADAAGDQRMVQIIPNHGNDKMFLTYADASSDGGCSDWTGTTWDGTGCNNQLVFETSGARGARQWLTFDWFRTPPPQPDITIYEPNNTYSIYTYSGMLPPSTTHVAYDGNSTSLPPPSGESPALGDEFPAQGYVNITSSDDVYRTTVISGAPTGRRVYQSFNFSVSDSTLAISSFTFTHEGRATEAVAQNPDQYYVYIYNWTSDAYVLEKTVFASASDVITEVTITSGFDDYIRNRQLLVLVEGDFTIGTGGNARADLRTDYVSLEVDSIPLLSTTVRVNASAEDDDDVALCEWAFYYTNGTLASTFRNMTQIGPPNFWFNYSTIIIADGLYDLTVLCNDTLGNRRNDSILVRIDQTLPVIYLLNPGNGSNFTRNALNFSWNVTDLEFENLLCNLTINTTKVAADILSTHNQNTTTAVSSITDGTHNWSVTCTDNAGNTNVSVQRIFDIDTVGPTVSATYPSAGIFINTTTINFTYTATDNHTILNCSLLLDGVRNTTTLFPPNGILTNFTINNLREGLHNWTVNCTDNFLFTGGFAVRNFTVDATPPFVFMNVSNNSIFLDGFGHFNFTVIDNIDPSLTCNITVNGVVVDSNFQVANNTRAERTVDLSDGDKAWSVTCVDDSGNRNTSATGNFTIIGGPLVIIHLPLNNTIGNGTNITFTYYTEDGDGVANCSLIIDGTFNQVNQTPITEEANNTFTLANLNEGFHNWTVSCADTAGYIGTDDPYNIVSDRTPPFITLNGPSAGQVLTSTPTRLNFTLTDTHSTNATCNITIDGVVNSGNLNFVAQNGTLTSRTQVVTNGIHYWNVTCVDLGGNRNTSIMQNFTVNVTFPLDVTVVASKDFYQTGEIGTINTTVRNESGSLVPANITLDLIFTNTSVPTDVPWWNTSWQRRKAIYLNETSGTSRAGKPVLVNVTGLGGYISSCGNEIRVVADDDLSTVAFNVVGGDDVTFCTIHFNATVSASTTNENNYHVYYNYSAAASPSHPTLVGQTTLFSDDFADAGTAGWTVDTGWDRSTNDPIGGGHAHVDGSVSAATMRPNQVFNLASYDSVNLSFDWQLDGSWDAGEFIRLEFTANSESTWNNSGYNLTNANGSTAYSMNLPINASYRTTGFNVRFVATVDNANEDGGFDNFNLVGTNDLHNVTSSVGDVQIFVERNTTSLSTGQYWLVNFTTLTKETGNYSSVARATTTNTNNRAGTGYDYFRIIGDLFGPNVTLVFPPNGSTNHSGSMVFLYYADDAANEVLNCSLYINSVFNRTNSTPINESALNNFTLSGLPESAYNWSVNCTDSLANTGLGGPYYFWLDDTPPIIRLSVPNGTTLSSGSVTFAFNATDNFDTSINCTLSVDSGTNTSTILATNNSNTTLTIGGISDGFHYWNVTCADNINNTNTSATFNFTVDATPIVYLYSPVDGYGVNDTNITLFYNLSESNVANCSLILNGSFYQVNQSPILYTSNNGANNFTLTGLAYGEYNWTVNCSDNSGFTGIGSPVRIFQLDNELPNITIHGPANNSLQYSRTIGFNFTVVDIDPTLVCNLTINSAVNSTRNITANAPAIINGTGFSAGDYLWNITCIDNTGFVGYSETRNFSVVAQVNVILNSPSNNSIDGDGSVTFSYTPQSIGGFSLGFCDLYLDDILNQTQVAPTEDAVNNMVVTGINQGSHNWSINCTDSLSNTGLSETRYFIVDSADPAVLAISPNGTTLNSTVTFTWNGTDNLDLTLTCNVHVNGTLQTPGSIASPNGTNTNATYIGFTDGYHIWNATCTDDAQRNGTSATLNFTVAEVPRIILNSPSAGNRSANTTKIFLYTPTDNSAQYQNCSLIIGFAYNQSNFTAITNAAQNTFNLSNLAEGIYNWTVNCTDRAGNRGTNATGRNFTIDLSGPYIALDYPVDGQSFNTNNILFNWTPTDALGSPTISCNVTATNGTGSLTSSNVNGAAGTTFQVNISQFGDGPHNWSVTCIDDVGNVNTSVNRTFIINQPDLYVNNSLVYINNTNPTLGQTVRLFANVSNLGGLDATNTLVMFWDGLPDSGINIGNSTATVSANSTFLFNISWNVTAGYHTFWIVVDPLDAISELNESNNNATFDFNALFANITSPTTGIVTGDTTPTISINVTDFTAGTVTYRIYVDGTYNGQTGDVVGGAPTSLDLSTLTGGAHTIIVQANDTLGRSKNSTSSVINIDIVAPTTTFITPNATWFAIPNATIVFNITDLYSTTINYSVYLDFIFNNSNTTTNNTRTNTTFINMPEGRYITTIQATDEVGNTGNSSNWTFFIDLTAPQATILTPNQTWYNTQAPNISFNITDNLDTNITWLFYVNGIPNTTGYTGNGTGSGLLSAVGEGQHTIIVQATDHAGNSANSSPALINVDLTLPNVTLISPTNDTNFTDTVVLLNFTASDNLASVLICNLTLDNTVVQQYNLTNGTYGTYQASLLSSGYHYWNVTCIDNATNRRTSETWRFYIQVPDLVITSGNITFSNNTPIENQTIEVNATIFNLGLLNVTGNITVQFWLGDPDAGGVQIGVNQTIQGLNVSQSRNVTINHTTVIGVNQIYVVVDPPTATNGSILESDETNNKAASSVWVALFQVFAGGSLNELKISDASIISAFAWNQSNTTGSNVFVADTGSSISFTSLYAIGWNITNGTDVGTNDFVEIDTRLNTTSLNDSVNWTFTSSGAAKGARNITAFRRTIINVPAINSTNTDAFFTGILWDGSDGGSFYNGTQDIVFVTVMNQSQVGFFGTYDYEIAIPARLREYIAGGGTVTFYTELR